MNKSLYAVSKFSRWYFSVSDRARFEVLAEIYHGARSDDEAARLMAEEIAKRHPEMEREAGVCVDEIMWESVVLAVKKLCGQNS
jgi:hypothetical protein